MNIRETRSWKLARGIPRFPQAEITLLHVLEAALPQIEIMESALIDTNLREEAVAQLSRWQGEAASQMVAKAVVRNGTACHEIVRAAEEGNVDLIILGDHGRTGLARAFMGSTAEQVVRHAPCPVLVILAHEHDRSSPFWKEL